MCANLRHRTLSLLSLLACGGFLGGEVVVADGSSFCRFQILDVASCVEGCLGPGYESSALEGLHRVVG